VAGIADYSDAADSDSELTILLVKDYSPYGETLDSDGTFDTSFGFTGEMTDDTGLINLRARWYAPGQGRFITKDSWSGDYRNPITLVKWVYANANPVLNVDPTGSKVYDRSAASKYANYWADRSNPIYRDFGDSDCTNFASQVLREGGLEDNYPEWYYNFPFGYFGSLWGLGYGPAWINTDKLFDFLTVTEGYSYQSVIGTIPYTDSANGISGRRIPNRKIISEDPPFILPGGAKIGDILFYRQKVSAEIRKDPQITFNHAAVIVDSIGPKMVDHSDPSRNRNESEIINETKSEVDELVVVHIPDQISDSSTSGCNYPPYLPLPN